MLDRARVTLKNLVKVFINWKTWPSGSDSLNSPRYISDFQSFCVKSAQHISLPDRPHTLLDLKYYKVFPQKGHNRVTDRTKGVFSEKAHKTAETNEGLLLPPAPAPPHMSPLLWMKICPAACGSLLLAQETGKHRWSWADQNPWQHIPPSKAKRLRWKTPACKPGLFYGQSHIEWILSIFKQDTWACWKLYCRQFKCNCCLSLFVSSPCCFNDNNMLSSRN